jgi:hypothetical protein
MASIRRVLQSKTAILERQHTTLEFGVGSCGAPELQFPFFSVQTDPGFLNGRLHPLTLYFDLLFAFFNRLSFPIFALWGLIAQFSRRNINVLFLTLIWCCFVGLRIQERVK